MVLWDVNLLLYAFAPRSKHHDRCRLLLQELVDGEDSFAISELVLSAVIRIATNHRAFSPPASVESAFEFCEALRAHPRSVEVAPAGRHWSIFRDLMAATAVVGSDTTDAYLAALAIEHGCEWWSSDAGFERFPGLRWQNPLARK